MAGTDSIPATLTSVMDGFQTLSIEERRAILSSLLGLESADLQILASGGLTDENADRMVENSIGIFSLPLGLCTNFRVDDIDRPVPMAIEEPSVIAAASFGAKLLRAGGGIHSATDPALMIGQVQLLEVPDPLKAEERILDQRELILEKANSAILQLKARGGGAVDIEIRHLPPKDVEDPVGDMLVVHLLVDVCDAMGANVVNTVCEKVAPTLAFLTGGRARLRIVSNLCDRRLVRVWGEVPFHALEGRGETSPLALANGIVEASVFAERDPYRAVTHNKGILNGMDAVLMAFGQDWRAAEASAHAFAARGGSYTALSRWRVRGEVLVGELELPLAVGTVGGVARVHRTARLSARISGVHHAKELAALTAAVGLAQNLAALRALAAEGIQPGHMKLHSRNVAASIGAIGHEIDLVAREIVARGQINTNTAGDVLRAIRSANQAGIPVAESAPPARAKAISWTSNQVHDQCGKLLEGYWPRILAYIRSTIDTSTEHDSPLREMIEYQLATGGKRLRAVLPLLVAMQLDADLDRLIPFCAACEILHNATLVHDDVQDGDTQRRGHPTVWSRFGVASAIDAGDAMLYLGLNCVLDLQLGAEERLLISQRLVSDAIAVIDGQEREMVITRSSIPRLSDYFKMVAGKTSALFSLPLAGAADICGAPTQAVTALRECCHHLGVLFQIQDDVLDIWGEKGRDSRGGDVYSGKRTLLVIYALETLAPKLGHRLVDILDKSRDETTREEVEEVIGLLEQAHVLPRALEEIDRQRKLALEKLTGRAQVFCELIEGIAELMLAPIAPLIPVPGV